MLGFRKKQPNKELQMWQVYLVLAVVFIALVLGIVQKIQSWRTGDTYEAYPTMNAFTCAAGGGVWEDEVCQCTSDAQCPFSFVCNQDGICSEGSFKY